MLVLVRVLCLYFFYLFFWITNCYFKIWSTRFPLSLPHPTAFSLYTHNICKHKHTQMTGGEGGQREAGRTNTPRVFGIMRESAKREKKRKKKRQEKPGEKERESCSPRSDSSERQRTPWMKRDLVWSVSVEALPPVSTTESIRIISTQPNKHIYTYSISLPSN